MSAIYNTSVFVKGLVTPSPLSTGFARSSRTSRSLSSLASFTDLVRCLRRQDRPGAAPSDTTSPGPHRSHRPASQEFKETGSSRSSKGRSTPPKAPSLCLPSSHSLQGDPGGRRWVLQEFLKTATSSKPTPVLPASLRHSLSPPNRPRSSRSQEQHGALVKGSSRLHLEAGVTGVQGGSSRSFRSG